MVPQTGINHTLRFEPKKPVYEWAVRASLEML
jgi:hypothetical protein